LLLNSLTLINLILPPVLQLCTDSISCGRISTAPRNPAETVKKLRHDLNDPGLGSSHLIGLDYSFGKERAQPKGLKFMLETKERTLAVGGFEPQNVSAGDAGVIADMFRNEIIREGSFNVVEKANMDKILQEQAFQQSGCTTQECAVKLGKVLNVRYLVVGSFGKLLENYVINIRVVDVESAKAVYSDSAENLSSSGVSAAVHGLSARLTEAVKKSK